MLYPKSFLVSCVVAGWFVSLAVSASDGQIIENIPPLPPVLSSGEPLEPDVTIREAEQGTVYEYRIEGKLVMIKVQPKGGAAPYYFVDSDGDGELEYTADDPTGGMDVNQWILFRW